MPELVPASPSWDGGDVQNPSVTASPYTFTASSPGTLIVSQGTVTTITLVRRGVSQLIGLLAGAFPMKAGDQMVIVYVIAPVVKFLPDY